MAQASQQHPQAAIDELMQMLALVSESNASFVEVKTLALLTRPLRASGRLAYRRPAHLEKITQEPQAESLVVDGDKLTLTEAGTTPRAIDLNGEPIIHALVDSVRGTLSGDLAVLRRSYAVTMAGTVANWRLTLTPIDANIAGLVCTHDNRGQRDCTAPGSHDAGERRRNPHDHQRRPLRPPRRWRCLPIVGALIGAALLTGLVFSHIEIRSDMADFLPQRPHRRGAADVARNCAAGAATSLILVGIEGAPPAELARISRGLDGWTRTARASSPSSITAARALDSADQQFLLAHRYLLSAVTTPAAFTTAALRHDLQGLLARIAVLGRTLAAQFGLADPPGAFLRSRQDLDRASRIRTVDGVWFAADRDRATAPGAATVPDALNIAGQDAVDAAIRAAFAASQSRHGATARRRPRRVRARGGAMAFAATCELLSIVSAVLIAALLLWRFRSLWVVGVIAVPIMLSIAAGRAGGAARVRLRAWHRVRLRHDHAGRDRGLPGAADRPSQAGRGRAGNRCGASAKPSTWRWLTAALGLTGMVFSGFPGLSQLGVFSVDRRAGRRGGDALASAPPDRRRRPRPGLRRRSGAVAARRAAARIGVFGGWCRCWPRALRA